MNGFVLTELERFVGSALGVSAWGEILEDAGLRDREYVSVSSYPEHELRDLVVAASRRTGVGVDRVLFDFGRFLAPDLVRNYQHLLEPDWRTLDLVEHAASLIDRISQRRASHAAAHMAAQRDERVVVVTYRSANALCAMVRGVVVGLADHFGESVSVREPFCAQKGALVCTLHVRETRSTDQQIPSL